MRILQHLIVGLLLLLASCDLIKGSQMESAVTRALKGDSRIAEFSFEVSYEGAGRVIITGEVDTPAQIDAVKETAAAVEGVTEVSTNISIADNSSSGLLQDGVVDTPYF